MTSHLKLKFYKNRFKIFKNEQVSLLPLNPDGLFIDIQVYYLNACYALFNFRDSHDYHDKNFANLVKNDSFILSHS